LPILIGVAAYAQQSPVLGIHGTRFVLDGGPFPYTGVSFFNALYNPSFNASPEARRTWLEKFRNSGINVLRVWGQWDNRRGFVDACPDCTMYHPDGNLRARPLERLKSLLADAGGMGMVVEFVLFSQESFEEDIRLGEKASEEAASALARELKPWRNCVLQVWNEKSWHTAAIARAIKREDPGRIVTSSPGYAGVLTGTTEETALMDFLSPHTSRQGAGKPWEIAPAEIEYLLRRYRKPVVDDEPARNGTASFGGPRDATSPYDHIAQILEVWRRGGYVIYHHDMFQMGAGHPSVPPSGIPDPAFSPYHKVVFDFLARRDRYFTEPNSYPARP
jgi:hypothetical protein